jgi:hypothetical protein
MVSRMIFLNVYNFSIDSLVVCACARARVCVCFLSVEQEFWGFIYFSDMFQIDNIKIPHRFLET